MRKLLLVSQDKRLIDKFESIISDINTEFESTNDLNYIFKRVQEKEADVIIIDCDIKKIDLVSFLRRLKIYSDSENIILTLIIPKGYKNYQCLKYAHMYIVEPINKEILLNTINSAIKIKNSQDLLSKNNSELAGSLYLLDVMYNTSTKLAGTLDKTKLIDIMIEGLEKSLSFELSYTLMSNDDEDFTLIINSLYSLSERFEHAIKLRALLSYNNLFENKEDIKDLNNREIKTIKHIKHPFNQYDLNVLDKDNLFSPISTGEKIFGLIEVFREEEFTQEDATCFQTISKQVSLPLESAILYEQIKKTNAKLELLERMKSEFISIVSHELRTPLTAIKNSLDIVLSGKSGEISKSTEKFTHMAKRNVQRLSGIINDLLDLSKVEAGKMEFRFEKNNINMPIEFVKNTFENLAKDKKIKLETSLTQNVPLVYIDSQRIEQIITNLVSNSIKFTKENGKITISTEIINGSEIDKSILYEQSENIIDNNLKYIKVSVIDNGIGIEEKYIHKVFDKFRQIENSLNRKIGGTGLGLPIAKEMVNAHRGIIWAKSKPNVETIFSFCLPILNDKEIFLQDLNRFIQTAKQNKTTLGIMGIKEPIENVCSVINDIKNDKFSLIRKTNDKNEFYFNDQDYKYYYILIFEADKFVIEFIKKKLESYIASGNLTYNSDNKDKCVKILISSVLYPIHGSNSDELLKKSIKSFKEL